MFGLFALAGSSLNLITLPWVDEGRYNDVLIAIGRIASGWAMEPLVELTGHIFPMTMDGIFWRADRFLGFRQLLLSRAFYATPWAWHTITISYAAVPLMVGLVYSFTRSRVFIWALAGSIVGGVVCYFQFPATGPVHAFAGFPWSVPSAGKGMIRVSGIAPRNAMPSPHFTWAILLYVNAGKLKVLMSVFLLLTAFATLASGEHYLVDLLAAVPFSIAIQSFAEKQAAA